MQKLMTMLAFLAMLALAGAAPIHDAATGGDLETVRALLKGNAELLNIKDNTGKTPLHCATYSGKTDVAKYLIENGAALNTRTNSGSTPLHGAAFYGHYEAASLLVDSKANIDIANNFGYTPLLSASAGGHLEIVKMLLQAGANRAAKIPGTNANALLMAGSSGNLELVDYYLGLGFDLNAADADGEGLLHYAAFGGNLNLVKRLCEQGVDINVRSRNLTTPAHYAAQNRKLPVIEFLAENGADLNAVDADNETCIQKVLSHAWNDSTNEAFAVIKFLVEHGADINKPNKWGQTPLLWAIYLNKMDFTEYFVQLGAELNLVTESGLTVLQEAIRQGMPEYVKILVDAGAKADIAENHYGFTALHDACLRGNLDIVKSVLTGVDNINIQDNEGHTPLYYASKYGHKQTAELLKSKGAREQDLEKNFGYAPELKISPGDGEAVLWYLGHCGWAIKTNNHLLLFDYWERGVSPTEPGLANGYILPDEIKNQNIEMFVSHEHNDHYDSTIFGWANSVKDLTYIFGFHPENLPENQRMGYTGQTYEYIDFHDTKTIDGMEITTIRANDAGQGFLIKVDGLTIYFAGDHAGWAEGQRAGFTDEIDFLTDKANGLDFAFINATGCHTHDTLALAEGTFYTLDKLSPKIVVPTHGLDREYVYKEYADKIQARNYNMEVLCADHRGDKFIYKKDKIM